MKDDKKRQKKLNIQLPSGKTVTTLDELVVELAQMSDAEFNKCWGAYQVNVPEAALDLVSTVMKKPDPKRIRALVESMSQAITIDPAFQLWEQTGDNYCTVKSRSAALSCLSPSKDAEDLLIEIPSAAEIMSGLSKIVIGQEHAVKTLAIEAYHHFTALNNSRDHQSATMLIGRTGTGKTLLAHTLAQIIGAPYAYVDASQLTKSGYVGLDVGYWLGILEEEVESPKQMEKAIVFIDEVDKITDRSISDIGTIGVQQELLSHLSGGVMKAIDDWDAIQEFNPSNIMYIFAGSFEQYRTKRSLIGFGEQEKQAHRNIEETILEWGVLQEFRDRIRTIVELNTLGESDLYEIIRSPSGMLSQFRAEMDVSDMTVSFTDGAYRAMAHYAHESNFSARGFYSVIERVTAPLREAAANGVKSIVEVDEEFVDRQMQ